MIRILVVAGVLAAVAGPAIAQSGPFYIRGDVGIALGTPSNEYDTVPSADNASLGSDVIWGRPNPGVLFDAGIGYRFAPFLRFEGTIGYVPSMAFNGTFGSSSSATTQSSISALVGLASGYLDLVGLFGPMPGNIQPFILGGVGFANVTNGAESDYNGGRYSNTFSGATVTNVAWTVGAGVGVPLSSRLTLDVMYRYLDLGQRFVGPLLSSPSGAQDLLTLDRADFRVHSITVGLRFAL